LWGTLGSLIFALAAAFRNIDDTLFWGRQSLSDSCSLLIVAKMAQLKISGLRALDQTHLLEIKPDVANQIANCRQDMHTPGV
jgi:hypothetical protein